MKTVMTILVVTVFSLLIHLGTVTYEDHREFVAWGAKFDAWVECNRGPNWGNCEHLHHNLMSGSETP
jgi:hypothetical protein